ncbi:unnamed protein product, partial [Linum tenue]
NSGLSTRSSLTADSLTSPPIRPWSSRFRQTPRPSTSSISTSGKASSHQWPPVIEALARLGKKVNLTVVDWESQATGTDQDSDWAPAMWNLEEVKRRTILAGSGRTRSSNQPKSKIWQGESGEQSARAHLVLLVCSFLVESGEENPIIFFRLSFSTLPLIVYRLH